MSVMLRGSLLGIETCILIILLYKYFSSKKVLMLAGSGIMLVVSLFTSKYGRLVAPISVLSFILVLGGAKLTRRQEEKGAIVLFERVGITAIAAAQLFVLLALFALQYFGNLESFEYQMDIINTYIKNIYGTVRFSAFPFVDISIMILFYFHIIAFCLLRSKQAHENFLFACFSLSLVLYIFAIGFMYVKQWASENMGAYGEYLTGFEKSMITASIMIYGYWIYVLIRRLFLMKTKAKLINTRI